MATKENVRTVDSFLMNYGRGPCQYKRLFLDEGLMLHPGCVNFLVGMSLCSEAFVYGDIQQIPYINRVATFPYPKHLSQLEVDAVETRRTTLRCPADINYYRDWETDRKSTRLNSSHSAKSRMPSSA